MALSEAITSLRSDNEDLKAVKFATMTNYLPTPHTLKTHLPVFFVSGLEKPETGKSEKNSNLYQYKLKHCTCVNNILEEK